MYIFLTKVFYDKTQKNFTREKKLFISISDKKRKETTSNLKSSISRLLDSQFKHQQNNIRFAQPENPISPIDKITRQK